MSWSDSHLIKNVKKVHLLAFTVSVLLLAMIPLQSVSAAQLSIPITTTGSKTVSFRDISNVDPTPDPTISYNDHTGLVTITDFNADLDVAAIDTTTAVAGSDTFVLAETGVNSKTFQAILLLSSDTNIIYNPDPPESARATVTLDFSSTGNLNLSDVIIDDNEIANMCFRPVTHALSVELANGAALTSTDTVVKLSYANAIFSPGDNPALLKMYYKKTGQGWASLQPLAIPSLFGTYDFAAKTITSDPSGGAFLGQVTTGKFVLGFDTGCGGGGGGGLVRPGLVLNILAGLGNFGSGGPDTTPPSLVFSKPSTTGLKFADSLLNAFSTDPYEPIAPSTDSSTNAPVTINDNRYYPTGYANTFVPTQAKTGEDVAMTLNFLEASSVPHVALHFVDQNSEEMSDTDPMITFDNGIVVKSDPQGILGDEITFSTLRDGIHSKFNFGFSFDEPAKRHLMITVWDDKRNSANTKIFDAFDVTGEPVPSEVSHLIYENMGQYIITQDDVTDAQAPSNVQEPVLGFTYTESLGKLDRHDMTKLDNTIISEQTRASNLIVDKFNLDTKTFVGKDVTKPYDTSKRAPELTWSNVGHKFRSFTNTPGENMESLKQVCWQEHLKAQETLKSLLVGSKYKAN